MADIKFSKKATVSLEPQELAEVNKFLKDRPFATFSGAVRHGLLKFINEENNK